MPTSKTLQPKAALQLKEISIIPITSAPTVSSTNNNNNNINNNNNQSTSTSTSTSTAPTTSQPSIIITGNNLQSMADEASELLRKKRCNDRYDSSESSDSGVITMSCTDSNATSSDTSDPGSPYSHTSVSDDTQQQQQQQQQKMNNTITKGSKTTTINSSPPAANSNAKNLKRQAQQADKCDKKRAKKDDKLNNNKTINNVEVKLITPAPPPAAIAPAFVCQLQQSTNKKSNFAKSTLAAITSMNVFNNKSLKGSTGNNTMSSSPIVIPVPANPISQPPNLAQLSNNNTNNLSNLNKLTTYYKLKKDSNAFALEKLCNIFMAPGVRPLSGKLEEQGFKTINNNQTVAICGNQQPTKQPPTPINSNKKANSEKKTAKIAPVMPVARKTNSTSSQIPIQQLQLQHPQLKISPKKPVSIAPRIIEPKQLLKNGMLQQKNAVAATVINNATKAMTMTQQQQQHNINGQKTQQQRVLLAAIIPTSSMHQQQAQPPPLKMQNGLLHKTTTTTTTTTKLAPLLQFHSQPMLPNLIQLPNLIATANISKMASQMGKTQPTTTPNLYVNSLSNGLNGQQHHHHHHHQQQQQLFMNGAVIKLQPIVSSSSQNLNNSATMTTTNVPFTQANHHHQQQQQQHQQQAKFTLQHQQQQVFAAAAQQLAAQQMQQLFMSTPVLFNTASIPTVLSSQLAGLQHAYQQQQQAAGNPPTSIPALQPIQSSYFNGLTASNGTTTTNSSIQLPSISTLLQHHHHPTMAQAQQQFHLQHQQQQQQHHISNIPALMKTSMANSLFQTSQGYATLPPSLTITSGFMPIQQNHQQQKFVSSIQSTPTTTYVTNSMAMVKPQQQLIYAQATSKVQPPPLAPASMHPISITNFPKMFSVSSSSQTSPSSPPPLVMNQKITLPMASPKVTLTAIQILAPEIKPNIIAVVPPLPSPAKVLKIEIDQKIEYYPKLDILDKKCEITIVVDEKPVIDMLVVECAKSPILSQPKTIRFPPVNGKVTMWKPNSKGKGASYVKVSKIGMCNWEKCSKQFDSNSDLLDHMHQHHVNLQVGPFVCSWKECKVNGKESCSKRWLERHVMTHVGSKPFKCIVERCGMRFSNQMSLEKHVNGHFNIQDSQNANKRSSDPPQPKKTKKDHKKIKCRRQPWSARRFDFFDIGMMDRLQYRLEKSESVIRGPDIEVTFRGRIISKRSTPTNGDEFKVTWNPSNIINDEWMKRPEDSHKPTFILTKSISVKRMSAHERTLLLEHVNGITSISQLKNANTKKSRKQSNSPPSTSVSSYFSSSSAASTASTASSNT